ncbi:hypothetical protein TERMP_01647 [Thermococcus barophilus MP]|uniref:Uncharacterized protein n=1 Tax=Thermococcus barophilus (strain DSM 11836 / MP) TaxID=391623 RepID=F0LJA0_THEBM|nr:hypothetical protein TERMP_01647 [Thermococcus barophilus MP]
MKTTMINFPSKFKSFSFIAVAEHLKYLHGVLISGAKK